MNLINKRIHQDQNGFTLIELIVAVAVFTSVMTIGIGVLLNMVSANKKTQTMQLIMDNMNFALESMSREIKIGTKYHCGEGGVSIDATQDCVTGESYLAFEKYGGNKTNINDQTVFKLNNGQIEKSKNSGGDFLGITAPDIVVEDLKFYVSGAGSYPSDERQPKVIIVVKGYVKSRVTSNFSLQTTVSQRTADY